MSQKAIDVMSTMPSDWPTFALTVLFTVNINHNENTYLAGGIDGVKFFIYFLVSENKLRPFELITTEAPGPQQLYSGRP